VSPERAASDAAIRELEAERRRPTSRRGGRVITPGEDELDTILRQLRAERHRPLPRRRRPTPRYRQPAVTSYREDTA
jgi:hypothetical protein